MTSILPPALLRQVRTLALRGRRATDAMLGGEVRSVFRGTGMEFTDVRPYAEGDDVRHLDWNLLARTGHPYIKLYTETRELTLLLVVDRSASTALGSPASRSTRAREVASLLAMVALQQHDRVGMVAFGSDIGPVVPPGRGQRHVFGLVRRIMDMGSASGGTDLAGALRAAGALLKRRSLVVVLSDFLAIDWEKPLRGLAARHDVTAVVLDDQRDHRLPGGAWITLTGSEEGGHLLFDAGNSSTRRRAEEQLAALRSSRSMTLASAGVREVVISTVGDYLPALRSAFGRGKGSK